MEPEDRSDEIRRHVSELLPSTSGAIGGALVSVAVAGPAGALAGAISGVVLDHVVTEALARRRARGAQAFELAAARANLTPEQLLERILADERLLELAAAAIAAAAETTLNAKIRALGQALARGTLATDDAEVDMERFIVVTLTDLEAPHVRVLDRLSQPPQGEPGWSWETLASSLPEMRSPGCPDPLTRLSQDWRSIGGHATEPGGHAETAWAHGDPSGLGGGRRHGALRDRTHWAERAPASQD